MDKDDVLKTMEGINTTDTKETLELLLDKDRIDLITEIKDNEIILLSVLESIANKPFPSAKDLNLKSTLLTDFIRCFRVNRISKDRQSRQEIIDGLLGQRAQIGDVNLKGRLAGLLQRDMF